MALRQQTKEKGEKEKVWRKEKGKRNETSFPLGDLQVWLVSELVFSMVTI